MSEDLNNKEEDYETYETVEYTDESGVDHVMVILDTCEVDGTTYSVLVDASTIDSISPSNPAELHIVKYELQDGEQYLVSLEEAEFQTVIDRIENHLMEKPFQDPQLPEN